MSTFSEGPFVASVCSWPGCGDQGRRGPRGGGTLCSSEGSSWGQPSPLCPQNAFRQLHSGVKGSCDPSRPPCRTTGQPGFQSRAHYPLLPQRENTRDTLMLERRSRLKRRGEVGLNNTGAPFCGASGGGNHKTGPRERSGPAAPQTHRAPTLTPLPSISPLLGTWNAPESRAVAVPLAAHVGGLWTLGLHGGRRAERGKIWGAASVCPSAGWLSHRQTSALPSREKAAHATLPRPPPADPAGRLFAAPMEKAPFPSPPQPLRSFVSSCSSFGSLTRPAQRLLPLLSRFCKHFSAPCSWSP